MFSFIGRLLSLTRRRRLRCHFYSSSPGIVPSIKLVALRANLINILSVLYDNFSRMVLTLREVLINKVINMLESFSAAVDKKTLTFSLRCRNAERMQPVRGSLEGLLPVETQFNFTSHEEKGDLRVRHTFGGWHFQAYCVCLGSLKNNGATFFEFLELFMNAAHIASQESEECS